MLSKLLLSAIALIPPVTPAHHPLDDVHNFNILKPKQQHEWMCNACKEGDDESLRLYFHYCKEEAVGQERIKELYKAANSCTKDWQKFFVKKTLETEIQPIDREGLQVNYNPNIGPPLLLEDSGD